MDNKFKHEAIRELYSNVVTTYEDNDGAFTAKDQNQNDVSIDMSAVNAKATELETADSNKAQEQADLKASAKAKLVAGEALTQEEADTIVL